MPAKNTLKTYASDGFYHIYNRGVEKRDIFIDIKDYKVFLNYLKTYLLPVENNDEDRIDFDEFKKPRLNIANNNFFGKINLICYCLMPNHFHMIIRQKDQSDMEYFMRSIITKYVKYFNKRYKRVGPLFQSRYKAINILTEEYILNLSCYIHLNPIKIVGKDNLLDYPWSSYSAYVNDYQIEWLEKRFLSISYLKNNINSYKRLKDYDSRLYYQTETYKMLIDKDSP